MYEDYDEKLHARIHTDSVAAKAVASRRGLGRSRHLDTRLLWVQQRVRNKDMTMLKVHGKGNLGDLATKVQNLPTILKLMNAMGYYFREGRHALAKRLLNAG